MDAGTISVFLLGLAGIAAFAFVIRNEYRRTQASDDGTIWRQAGVEVDTARQTIRLGGQTLPVAKVFSVTTGHTLAGGQGRFPAGIIALDPAGASGTRIAFALRGSATTFAWRLRDALTRAGNTNPEATNKPFTLGRKE